MRVAVTGATGVIGRAAVRTLLDAGHHVVGLARTPANERTLAGLEAEAVAADIFDHTSLVPLFEGCDAVCNFATHVPVGYAGLRPGAWAVGDRLRTAGVESVVRAAREAGVRRVVQESVSFLYADGGDAWLTEASSLDITRATEPAAVGEAHVQSYAGGPRSGVILRFGTIVGEDPQTRWMLRVAARGRSVGFGEPADWAHLVHTDDLGPAVLAALSAPGGIYNVGATPVRRADLAQAYADVADQTAPRFLGPVASRLAGARVEPLTRSLRVCSDHFTAQSGWTPRRPEFETGWLHAALDAGRARSGHR